jgi:GT2 family glycosyltransferase
VCSGGPKPASLPTCELSIVIVSWNTRELLAGCLMSLERSNVPTFNVATFVVDNASTDGSAAMVRERLCG